MAEDLTAEIGLLTPELIELRRDFHRHPELAFQEKRTAQIVARRLVDLGLEVRTGVATTGVVAVLRGQAPGPTIAIRADMDALPLTETRDSPYKSSVPGAMHACGHDGHTAAVLTVATVLARRRRQLHGAVKFIFQPAEETAHGAETMLREGALRDPPVEAIVSAHLWNNQPAGTIGLREGPLWASADELRIRIKGRGGHGAMPYQTIDPIPISAHVVLALENLVAREVEPFHPVTLTIGAIQAGTAFNIIPSEVRMLGTLRTFSSAQRDAIATRIEDTVRGICLAMRAEYEFEAISLTPTVVNDAALTRMVREVAEGMVGRDRVPTAAQAMAGDDLGYFHNAVPGCYIMVGSASPEKGFDKPHHHPMFDFDEAALPVAVEVLARSALAYLRQG